MRRLAALLCSAAVLVAALPDRAAATAPTTAARPTAAPTPAPVTVLLDSMTPRSPDARKVDQRVVLHATLVNNSTVDYTDVQLSLERGNPIVHQNLLDTAIASPPATDDLEPVPQDQHKALPAGASVAVTLTTSPDSGQMCLCNDGVYPFALVASGSTASAGFTEIGRRQVFVPSFLQPPSPVSVSWVWPVLDRPHRGLSETVFTDDELAGEVRPGGRLDRVLRAAELVRAKVRLTLVIDPELIDSLVQMSSTKGYQVQTASGTVTGTGGPAAARWLERLRQLRGHHDFVLSAYANPDVNAVARSGLKFSPALDPQVQARIEPVVGAGVSSSLLTWPVGGSLTSRALDTLVGGGASTVLLSDAALPGGDNADPKPDALSPLPSAAGKAVALVTDGPIQATVGRILTVGGHPAADEQLLLGQLAVRAAQAPDKPHFVVIAPDQLINPDPAAAAAAMTMLAGTTWARTVSVGQALSTVTPVDRGALQTSAAAAAAEVPATALATLSQVQNEVASMVEALSNNQASLTLLGGYNHAVQRGESSAWRADHAGAVASANRLHDAIGKLIRSVHLVRPADGRYSLSSSTSPIVVTVANQLSQAISVKVSLRALNGATGFVSGPVPVQVIPAGTIATISIPTRVERLGRFQVDATLTTPDGALALGDPIPPLLVRATAIGGVTKAITIAAVSVLVLLLLRRLVRRIRRGRTPVGPTADQSPASAGASA